MHPKSISSSRFTRRHLNWKEGIRCIMYSTRQRKTSFYFSSSSEGHSTFFLLLIKCTCVVCAGIFLSFFFIFRSVFICPFFIIIIFHLPTPHDPCSCCLIYIKKRKYGVYDIDTASNENNLRHQRSNTRGVFTNSRIYTLR